MTKSNNHAQPAIAFGNGWTVRGALGVKNAPSHVR